ncbi:selenide, water dikinase SelD [candidate division KSB1 bacterium]|nr:selenide, water dikinase SelD [candidate division KSB1 bacterium]
MQPIYLDHNATTPIAPEVAREMEPFLHQYFGNPSSGHIFGIQARKAVEKARSQVASLLGCETDEIIFTSGGSEANNMAIKGIAFSRNNVGKHIITSAIEHPAVIDVCRYLQNDFGFEITYLPVDTYGQIQINDLLKAIRPETILITVMHANNEVGTIQPIQEIAKITRKFQIPFHTDAAQSVGKIATKVNELGVDLLSIAGHKLYAPKGIGALYVRRGIQLKSLVHGADHESGRRAGTENVLEIVGLGSACTLADQNLSVNQQKYQSLREQLWEGLKAEIPDLILNGHPTERLPNTLSVSFPGIDANTLLSELENIAASPGAACHTDKAEPSAVLVAMQVPLEVALGTVRFSTGHLNDSTQIEHAIEIISTTVNRLRPSPEIKIPVTETQEIKLTHFTHGLGCACKLRPQNLEKILSSLPRIQHPNILVGPETSDDAAVYKISEEIALVQTVDFFTPVVDDPYDFGAIAAANSLSDIYAMGASPLFALNIVGFPEKRLPLSVLEQILKGASDKAAEAGIPILGGHTIEDSEPKFGLAVTGKVHPEKVLKNAGALPDDVLILTKPLGLGILTTGLKRSMLDQKIAKRIISIMSMLNRTAAETAAEFTIHACTDVTGFGLLGHLKEMTLASQVDAELNVQNMPFIPEAVELAQANVIPGGTVANADYVAPFVVWEKTIPQVSRWLLCDAQTSGGLLFAVPANEGEKLMHNLHAKGVEFARIIGRIKSVGSGKIFVNP